MRPKKKILLLATGIHAEILRFTLETRGHYRVALGLDGEDALLLLRHGKYDALLAEVAGQDETANDLARQAKQLDGHIGTVLFSRSISDYQRGCHADHFIPEILCNSEVILNRVGLATARKRGPKVSA